MGKYSGKIFGIGLSKTGTTSLIEALQMLGYDAIHAERAYHIDMFQASADTPVAARYRQLDQLYPNSRFILTVRDMDSWLESCRKHFTDYHLDELPDAKTAIEFAFCRGVLYGIDHFDPDVFRLAYQRHVTEVREYFYHRPDDLLELNITAGEGFDKLCPFLGQPILDAPFPKTNVSSNAPHNPRGLSLGHYDSAARYYRQSKFELAREHLRLAILNDTLPSSVQEDWFLEWLAAAAAESDQPERFINMVFDNLPDEASNLESFRVRANARYHVVAAFLASQNHHPQEIHKHFLQAIVEDPVLIFNIGLISITLKSLFYLLTSINELGLFI